jgi:hypothetical protein
MPASKPTATEASKPGAIAHIGTLAVLDLTQKGANAAAVAQTPATAPKLKKRAG